MKEIDIITTFLKMDFRRLSGASIGMIGPLGAGKTSLVKKLLVQLDPIFEKQVHSPTFNICNIYSSPDLEVHHFDLYRVETGEELYDIEIWDSIENQGVLTLIEWIDQFPELLSKCEKVITISIDTLDRRCYCFKKIME
ncbi:MAG: tRNA (adenosine(37)-N6)-threonylcarbamoyltransferase complex ATPase subunit type 1 TsaE [SAR324 cluster bacterium]|nr:tRNA (adenosine(37)-N6)-threonylcarbamoyltransferase complex ATPase subunit type 1 TsaE [SAR324 cluster bacterium]